MLIPTDRFAPRWEITGMNGVKMSDEFNPEPNVYLATTVPKFPNYFVINGVRGCWANGTGTCIVAAILLVEVQD